MKSKSEVKEMIKKNFLCSEKFAMEIEKLVKENESMNYIEAICHYCDENSIEIENINKLISKPLKEKLRHNAQELNFMKKTSRAKLMLV